MSGRIDGLIVAGLDDEWRTVAAIRIIVGRGEAFQIATALGRLAAAGRVEQLALPTPAPKFRGSRPLAVRLYRRLGST